TDPVSAHYPVDPVSAHNSVGASSAASSVDSRHGDHSPVMTGSNPWDNCGQETFGHPSDRRFAGVGWMFFWDWCSQDEDHSHPKLADSSGAECQGSEFHGQTLLRTRIPIVDHRQHMR